MRLYSYFRSSSSYRVRIALNYKGLDYEIEPVHLLNNGGEQYSKEYTAHNPMQVVPALVDGTMTVTQSMAIVEYLDRAYPEKPLFPKDLKSQTRVRELCEIINSGIQPVQNLGVLKKLKADFAADDERVKNWSRFWMEKGFRSLETLLTQTAGPFCLGDAVSAADCFLVPQVYNAKRYGVQVADYPKLNGIYGELIRLDEVQKARPENQPDAPEDLLEII